MGPQNGVSTQPTVNRKVMFGVAASVGIVAILIVVAVWILIGNKDERNADLDQALADLSTSITEAETSASQARTALEGLERAAAKEPSPEFTRLISQTDQTIVEAEVALDSARVVLSETQSEKRVSQQQLNQIISVTASLDRLSQELDNLTVSVEEATEELHAPPTVDLGAEPVEEPQVEAGCIAPVPGAYPCAGGPIPPEAQPIQTVWTSPYGDFEEATLVTPSENIGCDVSQDTAVCMVLSWEQSMNPNFDYFSGGKVTAVLHETGPAELGQSSGALNFTGTTGAPAGQVQQYGTVSYYGDFVFASEEEGLTFWNANTGYGAFINRSGFYPFGPQ